MTSSETDQLVSHAPLPCKHCASADVVKHGHTGRMKQRYYCRSCGRTFLDNAAPPGMRFQVPVIASTLNSFYEGASLGDARQFLQLEYGVRPDHSSIHRWIMRYTQLAAVRVAGLVPVAGQEWVALSSEPPFSLADGTATEILDVVDLITGFLLATRLSFERTGRGVPGILELSAGRAGKWPDRVLTNSSEFNESIRNGDPRLQKLPEHISAHIQIESPPKKVNQVRAWLRNRTAVLAELTTSHTAQIVLAGWAVHYNFFRAHSALNGETPAARAGITVPFKNWADVVANGANAYTNGLTKE